MSLYFGNFDFEHQLGRSGPRTLPAPLKRINAELAYSLVAICRPGDFLRVDEPPEPQYESHLAAIGLPGVRIVSDAACVPAGTELLPWGWSPHVKSWGRRNSWRCDCPDLAVVATANSREFSSNLEREWNVGLPGARRLCRIEDFHDAVDEAARQESGWVVKANFGMSARERILGRGGSVPPQAVQWVQKQLAQNEAVYFEPWVERIEEIGIQLTVPKAGEPILEGVTPLLTDHLGTYRGSRLRVDGQAVRSLPDTAEVIQIVERAAKRVQQLGYFGPLGIDAMRYRTAEGEIRWRPLQDINARLTMGRLVLPLGRLVPDSVHASWLRVSPSATDARFDEEGAAGTRIVRTSPRVVGDRPASRVSLFIVAPTRQALLEAEAFYLESL